MSDKSGIEWTDATWNPVTGCTKVSPGCDNCYAETFAERFRGTPGHYFEAGFDLTLRPSKLDQPLRWTRPRRIFINSMSDLFHEDVPDEFIARVFAVMSQAPQHAFQLLTKRHGRMRSLLSRVGPEWSMFTGVWPLPNVWIGVSVEDQKWADIRIPALLETPAAVRWISAEPLLGPVELRTSHCPAHDFPGGFCTFSCPQRQRLDWVVVGGESGRDARPMHPDWARSLRDQCVSAGIPFLFKQHGQYSPAWGQPTQGDVWVAPDGAMTDWFPGDGHTRQGLGDFRWPSTGTVLMRRSRSKHDAGRELDGRLWDEYPAQREPATN